MAGRSGTNLDAIADMLAQDLAQRKIDRPHIAGNSLGGLLALELARRGIAASVTAFSPAGAWRNDRDYQAVARPFRIVHALMPLFVAVARPLLRFAGVRRALNAQAHGARRSRCRPMRFFARCNPWAGTKILPQLLTSMQRDGPIKPLAVAGHYRSPSRGASTTGSSRLKVMACPCWRRCRARRPRP